MNIIATHINYQIVCSRKLWLFANNIQMEHNSDTVYDGKLLHETSYPQRADKYSEIELSAEYDGIQLIGKIDFYDAKEKIIHETKRGKSMEEAHTWQVKFYIWLFLLNGVNGVTGHIEYPRLRKTSEVFLIEPDIVFLKETVGAIKELIGQQTCPPVINAKICKKCSYYELCYIDEL